MANFYKNETFNLTNTNLTTALTIATSAIAIVRTVQAVHDSASNRCAFSFKKIRNSSCITMF